MDLQEFVTNLLYEYDFFYCVCAFTLLLCFWDLQIQLVTCYIVSCAVCFTVAIIWHLYQRVQDRLREQHEIDSVPLLTDRIIQRTIQEQWDQLWLEYRTADPWIIIPDPDSGVLVLNRHVKDYIHYTEPLFNMPLHPSGGIDPWSSPYIHKLHSGPMHQIVHSPLEICLENRCLE